MQFIKSTNQGKLIYATKAALTSLSLSLLFAYAVGKIYTIDTPAEISINSLYDVFGAVIFAPAVETLLMIPVFKVISRVTKRTDLAVILSAATWAGLHSLIWIPWGFFVFIPFSIFSYAFLTWKQASTKDAVITVAIIHAIHNGTIAAWIQIEARAFT